MTARTRHFRSAIGGPRSSGFTLLETLLASALAAAMLLALWSLLNMYTRLFRQAPAAVEQSQVVRAVVDQIAHDLHCVIPPPAKEPDIPPGTTVSVSPRGAQTQDARPSPSVPAGTAELTGGLLKAPAPVTGVRPAALDPSVRALPPAQLIGEPNSLRMEILEIVPRLDAAESDAELSAEPEATAAPKVPALRHVHYELLDASELPIGQPDQADGVVAPAAAPSAGPALANRDRPSAGLSAGILVRRQRTWDALPEDEVMDTGGSSPTAAARPPVRDGLPETARDPFDRSSSATAELLDETGSLEAERATFVIPEVRDIRFRYFDGANWSQWWDSRQRGGLPLAVEVVLELARRGQHDALGGAAETTTNDQPPATTRSAAHDTLEVAPRPTAGKERVDPYRRRFVVYLPAAAHAPQPDQTAGAPAAGAGLGQPFSSGGEALP